MKKKIFFSIIFLFIVSVFYSQGLDQLAQKVNKGILDFFQDKYKVRTSIIKFENLSGQTDLMAHKFYQLLVSKLESSKTISFVDLLINFNEKRGQFNLNMVNKFNYWIYLKLIKNRSKIGAGLVIFSRSLDRIVWVKYFETLLSSGEKNILNTTGFGFKSLGFSKEIEIEANINLLDLKTVSDPNGQYSYYFYYPEKIIVYRLNGNLLKKDFSIKLKWGRPFYPVLEYAGRMLIFQIGNFQYLTVGNNFSPASVVFINQNNQWQEIGRVKFVPLKFIELNKNLYLTGSRYEEGKNHFQNKIILLPFDSGKFDKNQIFEKQIPYFYSLDFSTKDKELMSIHLVDRDYYYRFFAADFEEGTVERVKRGSSLSILDDQWLAVSDYTTLADKIYFYKVENGSRSLIYENEIPEEVVFISSGVWKANNGFWIYVKKSLKYGDDFRLQFWRKSAEPEPLQEKENNGRDHS